MKVAIFILATIGLTLAEPPVSYLPPSNQYGAPSQLSNTYGAPNSFSTHTDAIIKPNAQYGAPNAHFGGAPSSQYGAPDGGQHGGYGQGGYGRDDGPSEPANYHFQYHVEDAASGNDFGHEESRQGDAARGRYFVLLPDGRRQIVDYTADERGYIPKISYEGGYAAGGYAGAGGYPAAGGGHGGAGGYHHGAGNGGYNY